MNPNDTNAKAFNPRNARNPDEGVAYVIATGAPRHYVSGHGLVGGGALVRQRASITPGPTMLRLSEEQYQQALADPAFAKQLADKAAVQMREAARDKRGKAAAKPAEGPTVEELRAAQDAAASAEAAKEAAETEAARLRTELAAAEAAREAAEKVAAGAAPPPAPAPDGAKPAEGGGGSKSK